MPIYIYKCEKCGKVKEVMQSYDAMIMCCDKPMVRQMPTSVGIKFKGGGWYVTDYKGKK